MPNPTPATLSRYARYSQWPVVAETDWSRGLIRDMPRSSIPVGGVYDSTDFLFDQPGLARKRGGYGYQSSAIGTVTDGGINFVAAPEFTTGRRVIALGADGHLYDATSSSAIDCGAFGILTGDNPCLSVNLLVVAAEDGTTGPYVVFDGGPDTTFEPMDGSPPPGRWVCSHLSRVFLASAAATPARGYFSPTPAIDSTWDTENAYVDFSHSLTAVAEIQGVLLGFGAGATERLIGDTPPGTTGENMTLQTVGEVGCYDARSIAKWGGYIVFASQDGVYVTNGAGFDSLTEKPDGSGIQSYWRELFSTVAANNGRIAGGIYSNNYYIVTLSHGSTLVDTLICYLPRKSWARLTNVAGGMFAASSTGNDELFVAPISGTGSNRILSLSGMFTPAAANKDDANGVAVQPSLSMRMTGQGLGVKAFGHAHLTYDMRDAATDAPTLAVTVATGIESDSTFAPVAEGSSLAATVGSTRKRFVVSKDSQAVNLAFSQTGPSAKTEIYALEVESRNHVPQADGS